MIQIEVAPERAREALWAAARLRRRLAERPGFRGLRLYLSEPQAGTLLVLTEWANWDDAAAAEAAAPVAATMEHARAACVSWESRRLDGLFHLQLPHRRPSSGIAQAIQVETPRLSAVTARQKEFALKAMALPGTIGVMGGQCMRDPRFFFCALEFDSDDAMLDFGGSAIRREWERMGSPSWWRKESRLEIRGDQRVPGGGETERRSELLGNLSVRIESSPDGATVLLRLRGCLDKAAALRMVQVADAVVARGCRQLTLDVSDLNTATPEGLQTLVRMARQIKQAGGQFAMADNQGRYHRILRVWHLNRVLPTEGAVAPRRKLASVRFETPGSA